MRSKQFIIASVSVVCALLLISGALVAFNLRESNSDDQLQNQSDNTNTTQPSDQPSQQTVTPEQPADSVTEVQEWPVQISPSDAALVNVVVNKKHQLPSNYVPTPITTFNGYQLRDDTATAMNSLFTAATAAGYSLKMISGYRSYGYQQTVYNNYVTQYGQAKADTFSARPGFSEHQLGLTADVGNSNGSCDLEICFGDSAAGQWLAANAQNYGFIIRYPQGLEAETGYQYEPWHLRYLGVDIAKAVFASGKTLDQYYNIPAGGY